MTERDDLLAIGFSDDSGVLRIRNVNVSLAPLDGRFFRVAIALPTRRRALLRHRASRA